VRAGDSLLFLSRFWTRTRPQFLFDDRRLRRGTLLRPRLTIPWRADYLASGRAAARGLQLSRAGVRYRGGQPSEFCRPASNRRPADRPRRMPESCALALEATPLRIEGNVEIAPATFALPGAVDALNLYRCGGGG